MARAKKASIEASTPVEAVATEQAEELAVAVDTDAPDSTEESSTPEDQDAPATVQTETVAPETPSLDMATPNATPDDTLGDTPDATPDDTPPHPYEDKPETTNKCPYCNIRLARVPPDMFNPETGGTCYRQSCPACPYVERVDTETNRVFYVEWPIHK